MTESSSVYQYLDARSKMTRAELDEDDRTFYCEPGQEWPDYLDFIDDWKDLYAEKLARSRKVFIFHVLAKRHRTINCGDHRHTFSVDPTSGDVFFPNIDTYLDTNTCWYKTIISTENYLQDNNGHNASRLPISAATFIKRATQMYLTVEGYPHSEPTFGEFTQRYRSNPLKYFNANKVIHMSTLPPLIINDKDSALSADLPRTKPIQSISKGTKPWVPKNNESVLNDHGLHILLRSVKMDHNIFNLINDIRKLGHNCTGPMTGEQLAKAISKCDACKDFTPKGLSYPGAYYAPPGNGKTHALSHGDIVAIDTDWLIANSTYMKTVDPFLRINIPIITNQHDLFVGAPTKLIGVYDSHNLREFDLTPFPSKFKKILENLGDDAAIFVTHTRVSEAALALEISQWIQNESYRLFKTNLNSYYEDNDTKGLIVLHPSTLPNYIQKLARWDGPTAKKRRRYKTRKRAGYESDSTSPPSTS